MGGVRINDLQKTTFIFSRGFQNAKIQLFLDIQLFNKKNETNPSQRVGLLHCQSYMLSCEVPYLRFLLASLASTVMVAWGTIIRRSLGMSLPVAWQMP